MLLKPAGIVHSTFPLSKSIAAFQITFICRVVSYLPPSNAYTFIRHYSAIV